MKPIMQEKHNQIARLRGLAHDWGNSADSTACRAGADALEATIAPGPVTMACLRHVIERKRATAIELLEEDKPGPRTATGYSNALAALAANGWLTWTYDRDNKTNVYTPTPEGVALVRRMK